MSNSYTMEYGYKSLIYPARMFATPEDVSNFDRDAAISAMVDSVLFTRHRITDLACGTVQEEDADNCRVLIAAMRWILNAADAAGRAKFMAAMREREAAKAALSAAE
jgi:hypothetical protein